MVDPSHFAMVPRSDVPRSTFSTRHMYKTTFGTGYLIPIFCAEVLPGDVFKGNATVFARVSNLIFPLMDNMQLETFFFFEPCRLVWTNWERFMGSQDNPSDSIAFTIPQIVSPTAGFAVAGLYDYFGLPTVGQVTAGQTVSVSALPMRAYQDIYQEWFKDENLQNNFTTFPLGNGPDLNTDYILRRRNKRHDYFTSCLPWPLKGGVDVTLPISGFANVLGIATLNTAVTAGNPTPARETGGTVVSGWAGYKDSSVVQNALIRMDGTVTGTASPLIRADLSTATGPAINAMRLAIATQQFLEKDARGGTRYTELLRNHFGVQPEDSRLQRPEYIGGGRSEIQTSAIPQTSATGLTGGTSPQGALAAQALVADQHRFSYMAKEHGYIIGLAHVGADLTYQQGLHRMWTRQTRFDFYWPTFANLGEQAVRNDEIYATGVTAQDTATFGYQERWAEYRYRPSMITGLFRSTSAGTIDPWHLAQKFTALPTLATTFIQDTPPLARALAAGAAADNLQILFDCMFDINCTRPIPTYSVPGLLRF